MKPISVLLSALFISSAMSPGPLAAKTAACELSAADQSAIRDVMERYRQEWLDLDADGLMALFTEDVVLSPNGRLEPVEGRSAAREYWFPSGEEALPLTSFTRTIRDLGGCGDFGYVRGLSHVRWRQDGKPMQSTSAAITLLRKTAEGWRIMLQMWDSVE